jgi:transcriptional regulator with XRE-family HTH domain
MPVRIVPTLGENIKALRMARGLGQGELAARMGVANSAVNRWEKGKHTDLPLDSLLALAKTLAVSVEALLLGIDAEYDAMRRASPGFERLVTAARNLNDAQLEALLHLVERLLDRTPGPTPAAPASRG